MVELNTDGRPGQRGVRAADPGPPPVGTGDREAARRAGAAMAPSTAWLTEGQRGARERLCVSRRDTLTLHVVSKAGAGGPWLETHGAILGHC